MSVPALCKGDQVVKQAATQTAGSMGGVSTALADSGSAIDCLIQTMGAAELRKYNARGSRFHYNVFFSEDQSLTVNQVLKWTLRANATLAVPIYLRILDYYPEGRPGEDFLFIADCEVESVRKEST